MRMCVTCERTKHNDNENKRERERERERDIGQLCIKQINTKFTVLSTCIINNKTNNSDGGGWYDRLLLLLFLKYVWNKATY